MAFKCGLICQWSTIVSLQKQKAITSKLDDKYDNVNATGVIINYFIYYHLIFERNVLF